jgi:hypothetical protein
VATEYVQFVGALVLFAGILIGSYWFVYVPGGSRGGAGSSSESGGGEGSAEGGPGNTSAPRVRRGDER